jgi:single-stranded DNA-binding protein
MSCRLRGINGSNRQWIIYSKPNQKTTTAAVPDRWRLLFYRAVRRQRGNEEPLTPKGSPVIDCAFYGFCAADPDCRVSQAGKAWVRLRIGVGQGDEIQWVGVACFGKAAETAGALHKGDRVYLEGALKLDTWTGADGVERSGLDVRAIRIVRTHLIGRAKPPPPSDDHKAERADAKRERPKR